jgi:formylglycine-generating enzyme required for sulfatase activity
MKRLFCIAVVAFGAALASDLAGSVVPDRTQNDKPKHFTNSLGMKFVWLPPGTFLMGSRKEEEGRDKLDMQRRVTLTKGFYIAVTTVTQDQWQALMGNNPSHFKGEKNLPVETVSWEDCQAFVRKMRTEEGYRLPTDAEWEYACRAGSKGAFCYGDDPNLLGQYAWYNENAGRTTHPVGEKKPNEWGLYDMHGNVMQWCQDWYSGLPQKGLVDPEGPQNGQRRVVRGGCFAHQPSRMRSAIRAGSEPIQRSEGTGFRVVRDFYR